MSTLVADAGAHADVGQGLARLLNVCDGMVGQGLRILILLTTNEDLGTMHPATSDLRCRDRITASQNDGGPRYPPNPR